MRIRSYIKPVGGHVPARFLTHNNCFGAAELFRGEIEKVGIALRLREGCGGRTVIIPRYSCRRNSSTVSLLERPVRLRRVRLGPGERIELLVDMRPNQAGSSSTRR